MDPKIAVSGRDRSGCDFLGIVLDFSGFFGITKYRFLSLDFAVLFIMICSLTPTPSHSL
jgi:hypothetical protein